MKKILLCTALVSSLIFSMQQKVNQDHRGKIKIITCSSLPLVQRYEKIKPHLIPSQEIIYHILHVDDKSLMMRVNIMHNNVYISYLPISFLEGLKTGDTKQLQISEAKAITLTCERTTYDDASYQGSQGFGGCKEFQEAFESVKARYPKFIESNAVIRVNENSISNEKVQPEGVFFATGENEKIEKTSRIEGQSSLQEFRCSLPDENNPKPNAKQTKNCADRKIVKEKPKSRKEIYENYPEHYMKFQGEKKALWEKNERKETISKEIDYGLLLTLNKLHTGQGLSFLCGNFSTYKNTLNKN